MNYLELYNDVLLVVLEERPTNADRLFKAMNNRPVILNAFEKGDDGKHLAQFTLETLDDLIENNLIKGNVHSTKDGNVYTIERLTTAGHLYLKELQKPGFKEKLMDTLREEGIPLTPQRITKFIAKLSL